MESCREVHQTRNCAGIFDRHHIGFFRFAGTRIFECHCDLNDPTPVKSTKQIILEDDDTIFLRRPNSERKACAYYERGLMRHFLGQYDEAVSDYSAALVLMPDFPDAYAGRGDAYVAAGQLDKAKADYAIADLPSPDADALVTRCWVRAVRGIVLDKALNDCAAAIKLDANRADYYMVRCSVDYRIGKFDAAVSDCGVAIDDRFQGERIKLVDQATLTARAYYVRGLAKLKLNDAEGSKVDIEAAKDNDWHTSGDFALWGIGAEK
jgi:tetratricopeptide (TPR) repeat protein